MFFLKVFANSSFSPLAVITDTVHEVYWDVFSHRILFELTDDAHSLGAWQGTAINMTVYDDVEQVTLVSLPSSISKSE